MNFPNFFDPNEPADHRNLLARYQDEANRLATDWGWLLFFGIAFMALGLFALYQPFVTTLSITVTLAVLFIVVGFLQLVQAMRLGRGGGALGRFAQAVIAIVAGVLIFRRPAAGVMGIGFALTFYFFVNAFGKMLVALSLRGHRGTGWMTVSAVCSLLLGVILIATFPVSTFWMPGMFFGVDLVILGVSTIGLSASMRHLQKDLERKRELPKPALDERPPRAA